MPQLHGFEALELHVCEDGKRLQAFKSGLDEVNCILLVEDNPATSGALMMFLESQGYRVVCAYTGREAVQRFCEAFFDLVILDRMLPDYGGLQVCESIRKVSTCPVIMLSARTTEEEIVAGLQAEADDYVRKPFSALELLARVRRCLVRRTESHDCKTFWKVGEIEVDTMRRSVCVRGDSVRLTRSEFQILMALVRNPGRVFTRDQLMTFTFGNNFDGTHRTIDTHIWSLRKKLGEPQGNPIYILSEQGIGYRLSESHAI